jgi:hypothetical protein
MYNLTIAGGENKAKAVQSNTAGVKTQEKKTGDRRKKENTLKFSLVE